MKLTKYQHACFTVEKDNQVLVVDPGNFSGDFVAPSGVVGIVLTHEHADHFDKEQVASIIDKNPGAVIVAPQSICDSIEAFKTQPAKAGDKVTVGSFNLEFFGGEHMVVYPNTPPIDNVGVLIDDLLYYPGDSFAEPGRSVDTLALPAAAPWMKVSEGMEFLQAVKPRFAFPTHDAILSEGGQAMVDRIFGGVAEQQGTTYERLNEPIEL